MGGCSQARQMQALMNCAKGMEAAAMGVPFDIYRLKSTVSGNFIQDANRIATNVPIIYKVKTSKDVIEAAKWQELIVYELKGNFAQYHVGDVFVCRDTINGDNHIRIPGTAELNAFTLTADATLKMPLGARINTQVRILRPSKQQDDDKFFSPTRDNCHQVQIINGRAHLAAIGAIGHLMPASMVACRGSYGDKAFEDVSAMPRKSSWISFVPPLPGFKFQEGDRIEAQDGSKYMVVVPYGEEVGFVGTQLFIERENAG